MSHLLDVEKIGGMNVGEGSFSARIIDSLCPWNEGIWRFESKDGILQASRTSKTDCELTVQGLTALISGVHDPKRVAEYVPWRENNGNKLLGYFNR
jgi:hypothetical protein